MMLAYTLCKIGFIFFSIDTSSASTIFTREGIGMAGSKVVENMQSFFDFAGGSPIGNFIIFQTKCASWDSTLTLWNESLNSNTNLVNNLLVFICEFSCFSLSLNWCVSRRELPFNNLNNGVPITLGTSWRCVYQRDAVVFREPWLKSVRHVCQTW